MLQLLAFVSGGLVPLLATNESILSDSHLGSCALSFPAPGPNHVPALMASPLTLKFAEIDLILGNETSSNWKVGFGRAAQQRFIWKRIFHERNTSVLQKNSYQWRRILRETRERKRIQTGDKLSDLRQTPQLLRRGGGPYPPTPPGLRSYPPITSPYI